MSRRLVSLRTLMLALGALAVAWAPALAAHQGDTDRIYAIQSRLSTPTFQLFLNIAADATVASSGPLFLIAGGVYGAAFLDDTFYGTELDNASASTGADYYLITVPHEGATVGQGARVSASTVGFPNVEGLAAVEGQLYGTSMNFGAHTTTLITIGAATGQGQAVGPASRNVMLVGLAYDPVAKTLYAAGIPFGAGEATAVDNPNLYVIDKNTGGETLVGPLGSTIQSLSWDVDLGLIGSFDRLYSINTTTGQATAIGATDFTDGKPGSFNGIYALGVFVPEGTGAAVCGDATGDSLVTASDALAVLNTAVGLLTCPASVCDVDSSGSISATDALIVLRFAVGLAVTLICPPA